MKEEILINVTPQESRAAIVENGMLQEIYLERASSRGFGWQYISRKGYSSFARNAGCVY